MLAFAPDNWNITFVEYDHEVLRTSQTINEITTNLSASLSGLRFDCIIGHSMGGLIALRLAGVHIIHTKTIILIETNLRPAEPFYRNLLLKENEDKHKEFVMNMLQSEAPFYSETLKRTFKENFDFTSFVKDAAIPVYALYGDRGHANYGKRIYDLNLDSGTTEKITFNFIKNSCHLPMIENPRETVLRIDEILSE